MGAPRFSASYLWRRIHKTTSVRRNFSFSGAILGNDHLAGQYSSVARIVRTERIRRGASQIRKSICCKVATCRNFDDCRHLRSAFPFAPLSHGALGPDEQTRADISIRLEGHSLLVNATTVRPAEGASPAAAQVSNASILFCTPVLCRLPCKFPHQCRLLLHEQALPLRLPARIEWPEASLAIPCGRSLPSEGKPFASSHASSIETPN